MEEKLRFIFEHERRESSMTELCERYEITRQTGYLWLRRYREAGAAGLLEQSRAARRHPNQMAEEMEQQVLASGMEAIVLRYGLLYGPGTWTDGPARKPPLHVDAAAQAALQAVTRGKTGVYNIADDDGTVSIEKARKELGFDPAFRLK